MDNVIELLTSKEVIVVYIVIAVACLLCFIIYLVDRNQDKRKRKQNTKELNRLVEDVTEANEALDAVEAQTNVETPAVDPNAAVSPEIVADDVDVVGEDFTAQIPVGAIQEEQQKFMPEPADLQAYNSNFAEELEDDTPIREEQPIVANSEIAPMVTEAPVEVPTELPTEMPTEAPFAPIEDNMVLDQMNSVVTEAAPAVDVPEEDLTVQDQSLVPERERIEEIVYTNAEPTEEEATRELQKITEELEKAAQEETPMEPIEPEQPVETVEQPVDVVPDEINVPVPEEVVPEAAPVEENLVQETMENIPTPEIPVPDVPVAEEVAPEVPVADVPVAEEVTPEVPVTEEVNDNNIDVARYENDQEENAIISLDELERKSEEMYAANEETQYADEGNEPISLEDLENRRQQIVNSEINEEVPAAEEVNVPEELPVTEELEDGNNPVAVEETPVEEPKNEVEELETEELTFDDHEESKRKFKSTPFISPVFGFDRSNSISNLERVAQKEKADKFLSNLKDLQNRLNSN